MTAALPRGVRALAGLAALLAGGCAGPADDPLLAGAAATAPDPGYSASGADIVETGTDGRPRYRLRADEIRQDPATLLVHLKRPRMEVADAQSGPWRVSADSGSIAHEARRVELQGDVHVTGSVDAGGAPIEMRAPELSYDIDAERVSAPREVSVLFSGQWVEALGLEADLKARRLRLESRVHGRFTP